MAEQTYDSTFPTGQAVDAALTLATTAVQPGDLAVPTGEGQADGLMSHADKLKLNGIESGATADQTAQEIANAIDADATAETTLKSALGLGGAAYRGVPAQGNAGETEVVLGADTRLSDARDPKSHGHDVAVPTGEGQQDGFLSHADKLKLNGIESGATADQTAQEIATAIDADSTAEATLKSALGVTATASPESTVVHIKIAIVLALPGSPDANTLYCVTGS